MTTQAIIRAGEAYRLAGRGPRSGAEAEAVDRRLKLLGASLAHVGRLVGPIPTVGLCLGHLGAVVSVPGSDLETLPESPTR